MHQTYTSERIADVVEARTGLRLLIEMDRVSYDSGRESLFYQGFDLRKLDGLIVKKIGSRYSPDHLQRLELSRYLQERGVKIFSRPSCISSCLDRLSCTLTLKLGGIPMPETILTEDISEAENAVRRFGRAVFKPLFTSRVRGMQVLLSSDSLLYEKIAAFKALGNSMMYVQKMIDIPGRNLGIAFLHGRHIGSYARIAEKDSWNTTMAKGGLFEAASPKPAAIDLAQRAAALFGLDFTCVNVAEAQEGLMVFEVAALGGFRGLWEAEKIDVASMIVEFVLEDLSNG